MPTKALYRHCAPALKSSARRAALSATTGAVALVCASFPSKTFAQSSYIGSGFVASTINESGFFPPDTMGVVGPTQVAMLINGRYEFYNKDSTGTPLPGSGISLNSFWTNAGIGSIPGGVAFDPRIEYDPGAQRWYASSAAGEGLSNSMVFLAVSKSANLQDGWTGFSIAADPNSQNWADFPELGFDADGVYITSNMFSINNSSEAPTSLWAFPKPDLLQNTPTIANRVTFTNLPARTNQPTVTLDNTGLSSYPETFWRGGNATEGRATLSGSFAGGLTLTTNAGGVSVNNLVAPSDGRQPDGTADMDTDSDRISSWAVRTGGSNWLVQTRSNGSDDVLRWVQSDASSNAKQQEGTITIPGQDLRYGSIAVNPSGTVVIGFTASGNGPGQFAGSFAVVGTTSGGVTTFGTPFLIQAGATNYHLTDGNGTNRWGDYSATSIDPADPNIFWTFQEYATGSSSYAVHADEIVTNLAGEVYWQNATNGNVSTVSNWATGSTPGVSDHVIFSRPAASYTVMVDSNLSNDRASVRQGTVIWNLGGNTWALTNASQATPSLSISEFQGVSNLTVTGGGTLATVNAMVGAGVGSTGALTVTGAGTVWNNSDSVFVAGTSSAAGGHGTLTISSGAAVNIANTLKVWSNGAVNYTGGKLSAGNLVLSGNGQMVMSAGRDKALVLSSLSIDPAANLDLNDNAMIVSYGPGDNNATRDAIRNLLINGRNAGPGAPAPWNGAGGITSSYAHNNGNGFNLAIGYADNAVLASINAAGSYTSFAGQAVASSTILVQMTRGADANLDGKVDGSDVSIIGTHFNQPGSGQWYFGDFDYSGICDGNDISILGTTFGQSSPALSPAQLSAEFGSDFAAAFEAGASGSGVAVPEPATLAMIGLGTVALASRRRRRERGRGV